MDTTQSINLLKSEKSTYTGKVSALDIAIGVLEGTLEFQSNELKDQYESTVTSQAGTISGLESSLEEMTSERDEVISERDALLDEKESLLAQIEALSTEA